MTAEEAIKHLKLIIGIDVYADYFQEVCVLAKEALEKQIAKKPEKEAEENLLCPVCGSFLGYELECREEAYQMPHCQGCGQAINWSEGDE